MKSTATSKRAIGFAVTSALAGALLSGCTTVAPPANLSASQAEAALADGKQRQAIAHAEAAVLAEPRNAAHRALLASAYLDAGRFASAETTFRDAMQLGDASGRTVLSLSLALSAQGKYADAATLLNEHEGAIAAADLGLALALSGQPERGIHVMSTAIRSGDNTAKMRQNLAYSYALAGRWREARLMASQDVPPAKINERIEEWARMVSPEAWYLRVAALLQVPAGVSDAGQPVQLALANHPSIEQLASEAAAPVVAAAPVEAPAPVAAAAPELPPLAVAAAPVNTQPLLSIEPVRTAEPEAPRAAAPEAPRASTFQAAFASAAAPAAPVAQDAARFAQAPVAQAAPARSRAAAEPVAARAAPRAEGSHLVQLGSFSSEQGARRAWSIYVRQYPELAGHDMVISEAVVRGKRYFRVSAAGFGKSSSSAMCGRVKSRGAGCFAYAASRPLPGAVDTGVRMARR